MRAARGVEGIGGALARESDDNSDAFIAMVERATKGFNVLLHVPISWAKVDEHYLIFAVIDDLCQSFDQ